MNRFTETWILFSAAAGIAGWVLSALHQLNAVGYLVFFGLTGGLFWLVKRRREKPAEFIPSPNYQRAFRKLRRRFRRPLPLAFLLLALLAVSGGVLHPGNNYDELTYRLPRVLHWLAESRWHWINAEDARLNTRAAGFEWLSAPLLAILHSDRPIFLINALSYLLFPGLVYSVFIRLGVRKHTAWCWMWLLPAGCNFALQAGSTANDAFSCIYVLSAVGFALRARQTGRLADLWLSILAAALLTGAKGSNLPLLLPCAVACWPARKLMARRLPVSLAALAAGALVSFLPTAWLNLRHCGDWTGTVMEYSHFNIGNPLVGVLGNAVDLTVSTLLPPILPLSQATGDRLAHLLPAGFIAMYNTNFAIEYKISPGITTEDAAGLGLGIVLVLAGSVLAATWNRFKLGAGRPGLAIGANPAFRFQNVFMLSVVAAFITFCAKAGMGQVARLATPYYPLLAAVCLGSPIQDRVVRSCWWKCGAALSFLMAFALVILSPARPLLPTQSLLDWLHDHNVRRPFLERANASYAANSQRNDGLGPLRALIPAEVTVLGFVTSGDDLEPSLWRPFGQRRVVYVQPSDSSASMQRLGVRYVVVSGETLARRGQSWKDWLTANHAEETGRLSLNRTYPPYHPYDWYVARLN